jgi:hypothetical protein
MYAERREDICKLQGNVPCDSYQITRDNLHLCGQTMQTQTNRRNDKINRPRYKPGVNVYCLQVVMESTTLLPSLLMATFILFKEGGPW